MRFTTPSVLGATATTGIFLFLSCFVVGVRADLKYYIYTEEEQHTTNAESTVVILQSVGSLPLRQSTFSTDGDACPEMVFQAGGINPKYLCAGSHPQTNNDNEKLTAFFPIAPTDLSGPESLLPFRFAAFQRSRGTSSGLLSWRNALAVDLEVATSETQPQSLDAVSMGIDTSRDAFNSEWINSSSSIPSFQDGEVVAEWYLLTEEGGEPIRNGGVIQLIKGKPPSLAQEEQSEYSANDENVSKSSASATSLWQQQQQQQQQQHSNSCKSIAETICDDDNNDRFGTMCSLMMQVGLDKMFSFSKGTSFTLYAPTNDGFVRAFADKPKPALLSGHDLTKLLLSHVIVTSTSELAQSQTIGAAPTESGIRYEEMICGTKNQMASDQITKIGCDSNAEVAYVLGAGNGGKNSPRPKFLEVDHTSCNGIIHTLDYVILPSDEQVPHTHVHNTEQSSKDAVTDIESSSTNNITEKNKDGEDEAQQQPSFASKTNQLDDSEIMSFFQQTMQDLGVGDEIPPATSDDENNTATTTSTTMATIDTTPTATANEKNEQGIDTESGEFHSFFGRTGAEPTKKDVGPTREGNLRRR